jgi:hypothetical protein
MNMDGAAHSFNNFEAEQPQQRICFLPTLTYDKPRRIVDQNA